MPRTSRPALLAAALAAALLLGTGCTSSVTGTAAPTGGTPAPSRALAPTGDPVAWVDDVCGALTQAADITTRQPRLDPNGDSAALLTGVSDYFGQAVEAFDAAIAGLGAAGPSPIEGGDELVTRLTDALTTIRTPFQDAKAQLDAADPNDPASLAALPAVLAPLAEIRRIPDPASELQDNPELRRAAEQAPNCQQLDLPGN